MAENGSRRPGDLITKDILWGWVPKAAMDFTNPDERRAYEEFRSNTLGIPVRLLKVDTEKQEVRVDDQSSHSLGVHSLDHVSRRYEGETVVWTAHLVSEHAKLAIELPENRKPARWNLVTQRRSKVTPFPCLTLSFT